MEPFPIERLNVLGVQVGLVDLPSAIAVLQSWIDTQQSHYVCVTGVHGIVESLDDPRLRAIYNRAGLVTPDGMPLVWLAWLHGHRKVERVYGPDLMRAAFERSCETGWRHFLYGGGPGVADRLAAKLGERFAGARICGTWTPPFGDVPADEDARSVSRINASRPDIVWVGLGAPKQERWMEAHVDRIVAPVLVGVGAAFDFLAGLKPQAPRWIQRSGFEWLFRLLSEPRRLGPRYLKNNPRFIWHVALQLTGLRRYD